MGCGGILCEGQEVFRRFEWVMKQSGNMNPARDTTIEGNVSSEGKIYSVMGHINIQGSNKYEQINGKNTVLTY